MNLNVVVFKNFAVVRKYVIHLKTKFEAGNSIGLWEHTGAVAENGLFGHKVTS